MSKIKNGWVPAMPQDEGNDVDWSQAVRVGRLPNLKFSTTTMNVRVPQSLLDRLKVAANRMDVPYQSLVKTMLDEALRARGV